MQVSGCVVYVCICVCVCECGVCVCVCVCVGVLCMCVYAYVCVGCVVWVCMCVCSGAQYEDVQEHNTTLVSPVAGKMLLPTNLLLQSVPQVLRLGIPVRMGLQVILKPNDQRKQQTAVTV